MTNISFAASMVTMIFNQQDGKSTLPIIMHIITEIKLKIIMRKWIQTNHNVQYKYQTKYYDE